MEPPFEIFDTIYTHWNKVCNIPHTDIICILLGMPPDSIENKHGYTLIKNTALVYPTTVLSPDFFDSQHNIYLLCKHILSIASNTDPVLYTFIQQMHPTQIHVSKQTTFDKLLQHVHDELQMDIASVGALTAQRVDLQTCVSLGYAVFKRIFETPQAIYSALTAVIKDPWILSDCTHFLNTVRHWCIHAAIAIEFHITTEPAAKNRPLLLATIESTLHLYMCRNDQILLLYLLTFHSPYTPFIFYDKYANIDPTLWTTNLPPPLASFWRHIRSFASTRIPV